jgi:hypothetical protein
MVPILLQKHLVDEVLPEVFEGTKFLNTDNEKVNINFYEQYLPKKRKDNDVFPFVNVILLDGEEQSKDTANSAHILFMVGVYDENENNQGYQDSIIILNKIYQHLREKELFDSKYVIDYPIKWMTNDDVTYPYFYSALETNWEVAKVLQTNENLYS